jgi:hypothetical protein
MVCFAKPLAFFAVAGVLVYLIYHKAINHILAIVGVVVEYVFMVAAAITIVAVVSLIMRVYMRRRAATGACLTCVKPCQLGDRHVRDTQVSIPVHALRLRDKSENDREVPALQAVDDKNVTSLAAWKERHEEPFVG